MKAVKPYDSSGCVAYLICGVWLLLCKIKHRAFQGLLYLPDQLILFSNSFRPSFVSFDPGLSVSNSGIRIILCTKVRISTTFLSQKVMVLIKRVEVRDSQD